MKTCEYGVYNSETDEVEPCGNICEGSTDMCASHNAFFRKLKKQNERAEEKRKSLLQKAKEKNLVPRKVISKNPKDWQNTFAMSNGERVTQNEINQMLSAIYSYTDAEGNKKCKGCGANKTCHAHIIPKGRCKQLGKTELIWDFNNYFDSCFKCNSAIENPKGDEWQSLLNIQECLRFIKLHDPELFSKFESRLATQNPTI